MRRKIVQSKRELLRKVRDETKPPKGFGQWVVTLERKRLSHEIGLFRLEAQLDGKLQWSGSFSVNVLEERKFGPDGNEIPNDWDRLAPGHSSYNVLTFEMRGKSMIELIKNFAVRSLEEGKIQDILPWGKG